MQTYLPEPNDKPQIQFQQSITKHDIFQHQLLTALNDHPLEMAQLLARYIYGLKGRLLLLPQMREVADILEQAIAGLDMQAIVGGAGMDDATTEMICQLWQQESMPLLQEKIQQLRNYQLKYIAEFPVSELASTNSGLGYFQPPSGYVDLLIDLDAPFARVPNVAPVYTLRNHITDVLYNTSPGLALDTGILRLEALYLPLGHALNLNLPKARRQADAIFDNLQKQPGVKEFIASFEALIVKRYARFSQHEYLYGEIKMACPPPDDLIKQVNKYPRMQAKLIGSDRLLPAGVNTVMVEYPGPVELSGGMTRRLWDYGLQIGERWDQPARFLEMEFPWVQTHVAVMFPGKYHHAEVLEQAGLIVMQDLSSAIDAMLMPGRDSQLC